MSGDRGGERIVRTEEATRARVLEQITERIVSVQRPHPVRVAIDGRTAAGKTTLANELVAPIERRGRPVIRVEIDDFHRPRAERRRRTELPSWERYYRDSFDHPAIRAAFLALGSGGSRHFRAKQFDSFHDRSFDEPEQAAPPDAIVLADGVFLFRPELDDLWDVRIFVEIDAAESLRRGPPRDRAWIGSIDVAAERYRATYLPGEQYYLDTIQPGERADAVLDNRNPAAPRLQLRP